MLFSIIIPLYNKEKGVKTTIKSILNQAIEDYEIVIVDDGSTDKSVSIVNEFCDKRIRIISQRNGGPSSARNRGLKEAVGEWILFLDADDELLPEALDVFLMLIKKYNKNKVFCCNHIIETNGHNRLRAGYYPDGIIGNNYRAWFFNILLPCQGSTLFYKSVLREFHYPENLRRWEDAAMMFDIMRTYKIVRCHLATFIYHRSLSEGMYPRQNFQEDFGTHLKFQHKSLWEQICLYRIYEQTRLFYDNQCLKFDIGLFRIYAIKCLYKLSNTTIDVLSTIKHLVKIIKK